MLESSQKGIVYLVDDDIDDQYLVKSAFGKLDHMPELKVFNDGAEVLEYLADFACSTSESVLVKRLPSLILLDLNMPNMNGKETLMKIKAQPELRHIPVIVYTTSEAHHDVEELYRLGANAYLVKPGSFSEMVSLVGNLSAFWFETASLQ